ncbi:MAG TPA: methyltransferase [Edaphocola sp.]|nr:methyltransferase [Edaphocola sp.]
MANSWFQFKRFKISQEHAAMKISTDACIFGAWLNTLFKDEMFEVLDVGTGTGLLSLMFLQENPGSRVWALEPEAAAAQDALANFERSGWKDNIILETVTLGEFAQKSEKRFDLVISNPPFFQNQLKAERRDRNMARHDALPPGELAEGAWRLANAEGFLAVIYPDTVWKAWTKAAEAQGWHLWHQLNILPAPHKAVNRICGVFGRRRTGHAPLVTPLLIREGHQYTGRFKSLLQPYYLNL